MRPSGSKGLTLKASDAKPRVVSLSPKFRDSDIPIIQEFFLTV